MSDELKACPLCKGESKVYKVGGWYKVQCTVCLTATCECFTEAEAIEKWQTRPLEDALRAELDQLEVKLSATEMANELLFKDGLVMERDNVALRAERDRAVVDLNTLDKAYKDYVKLSNEMEVELTSERDRAEAMVTRLIKAGENVYMRCDGAWYEWKALVTEAKEQND